MTSTTIYPSFKVLPYVYVITHKTDNRFYIGYRRANKISSNEDLPVYKTSSSTIKSIGFENFNFTIIAEFFDVEAAYLFEQRYIEENIKNPLCLNKHYVKEGSRHFNSDGSALKGIPKTKDHCEKISKGLTGIKRSDETRKKNSDAAKIRNASEDWENPFSSEKVKKIVSERNLEQVKSGTHPFQNEENKAKAKKINDEKLSSGTHPFQGEQGSKLARERNLKSIANGTHINQKEFTCPYCSKVGIGRNMFKYHFNNCKFKEKHEHNWF